MGVDYRCLSEATTLLTLVMGHHLQVGVVHHSAIIVLSEVVVGRLMDHNRLARRV